MIGVVAAVVCRMSKGSKVKVNCEEYPVVHEEFHDSKLFLSQDRSLDKRERYIVQGYSCIIPQTLNTESSSTLSLQE